MANTFELISSVTVGSGGAATISFTSIPATFTDLCLKLSLRDNTTGDARGQYYVIDFNTGGTYSTKYLQGNGSGVTTGNLTNLAGISDTAASTSNTFANDEIYIPNYRSSNAKSYSVDSVTENNATGAYATLVAGLWSGTAAITTITLTPTAFGSWAQYTTAYLYGVKNA